MAILIDGFAGEASQTRCFLHIINLVAKSLICQFEVKTKLVGKDTDTNELELLNDKLGEEEEKMIAKYHVTASKGTETVVNDNKEGWVDEMEELEAEEWQGLEVAVQPVKTVLVKVSDELTFWNS